MKAILTHKTTDRWNFSELKSFSVEKGVYSSLDEWDKSLRRCAVYGFKRILLGVLFVTAAAAQSPEIPLSDKRLTVHTLVREDIFAGLLTDDMERFTRGEKNIELLLQQRPAAKADLLAWKGSASLYRAVRAYEDKRKDEFEKYYKQALDFFAQANQIEPQGGGVMAITGGSFAVLGDRLPKDYQGAGWSKAYDSYQFLYKAQAPMIDKLPVHLRGETLGGLATAAQRTGHTREMNESLDKILVVLRDTPYESIAKKWKASPESAGSSSLTCLTCHDAGRLNARLTELGSK